MMHALLDGIRRVGRAPAVVLGVCVITLLTAAPLGIIVHEAIATDLGSSTAAMGPSTVASRVSRPRSRLGLVGGTPGVST